MISVSGITAGAFAAPVSVTAYIPKLKLLCKALQEDGRAEIVSKIVDENPVKDPSCTACNSLFGSLKEICKVKKIKGKEMAPSPKKQREPNIVALHYASEIGIQISQDEKNKFELYKAMKKLLALLVGPFPGRAEAEIEYFDILATYIEAGFSDVAEEIKKQSELQQEDDKKNHIVNDIFD